jgi:hypothetical protein
MARESPWSGDPENAPVRHDQPHRCHLASFAQVTQNRHPVHSYSYPLEVAGNEDPSNTLHEARTSRSPGEGS